MCLERERSRCLLLTAAVYIHAGDLRGFKFASLFDYGPALQKAGFSENDGEACL